MAISVTAFRATQEIIAIKKYRIVLLDHVKMVAYVWMENHCLICTDVYAPQGILATTVS